MTVNESGDDFALLLEDLKGDHLLRRAGLEDWGASVNHFAPPVLAGDDLVTVDRAPTSERYSVRRAGKTVYTFNEQGPHVDIPVKGLWSWNGHWVLEVDGQVMVDGKSLNQELGYDEIFNWRLLQGQPFYFFKKGNRIGVSYAGQALPQQYEEVIHYRCCEPAAFNPGNNEWMVWFHALRDGTWHYVEMGVYE